MSVQTELQAIYDKHGVLTPNLVVEEAKRPDHPLHRRFDWDDSVAARRWRLSQAGQLIRSVTVIVERPGASEPIAVRAFVSETEIARGGVIEDDAAPDAGRYMPVEDVIASDTMRSAWFQSLRRDWERLRRRAGDSQEFAAMVLDDLRDMAG